MPETAFFGSPAVSERPVALRTGLAAGVPLSEGIRSGRAESLGGGHGTDRAARGEAPKSLYEAT
jgi:hypothetical protein